MSSKNKTTQKDSKTELCKRLNITEVDPRLKQVYSLAWDKKFKELRELIVSYKLSKEERCDRLCHAIFDGQKEVAMELLYNGLVKCDIHSSSSDEEYQPYEEFRADEYVAFEARHEVIEALKKKIAETDFPASLFVDFAISIGDETLLVLLLDKGGDVRAAIQQTVMQGNFQLTKLLFPKADVNTLYEGSTLLHYAALNGDEAMVELLLQHGACVNAKNIDGTTALCTAVDKGSSRIVRKLIQAGADIKVEIPAPEKSKIDPCREKRIRYYNQHLEVLGIDYEELPLDHPSDSQKNWTLLHCAVYKGHEDIVNILVQNGSDINAVYNIYTTPLYIALTTLQEGMVKVLHEKGADIHLKFTCNGQAFLHYFASCGFVDMVELALKYGADIDVENSKGETPLALAAGFDEVEMVKFLVGKGARMKNQYGETPLHKAAADGTFKAVLVLLRHGVDTLAVDRSGKTALQLALENCYHGIATALRAFEVDSFADESTLLLKAVVEADEEDIEDLLQSGAKVDVVDSRGRTALHLAAEVGRHAVVDELLKYKPDIHAKDAEGATALSLAVFNAAHCRYTPPGVVYGDPRPNHLKIIRTLLRLSADYNSTDNAGRTPLKLAASGQETKSAACRDK